jgi:hypothetical protein
MFNAWRHALECSSTPFNGKRDKPEAWSQLGRQHTYCGMEGLKIPVGAPKQVRARNKYTAFDSLIHIVYLFCTLEQYKSDVGRRWQGTYQ